MCGNPNYDDRKLLDRDYWLSDFYFECLDAIPSPEIPSPEALLNLKLVRFRMKNEVVDSNFTKDGEMQPIVADGKGLVIISEKCSMAVESVTPNDKTSKSCLENVRPATSEGGIGTKGAAGIGSGVGVWLGLGLGLSIFLVAHSPLPRFRLEQLLALHWELAWDTSQRE